MMKYSIHKINILTIILLIILSSCNYPNIPTENQNKIPNIKSETQWLCDIQTNSKISVISRKTYDINGNITSWITYNDSGEKSSESVYSYNQNMKYESRTIHTAGEKCDSVINLIYSYNQKGFLDTITTLNISGDTVSQSMFDYDFKGNLLSKIELKIAQGAVNKFNYKYQFNGKGEVSEIKVHNQNDSIISWESVNYASGERTVKVVNYKPNGLINYVYLYKYNIYGWIDVETESDSDGRIIRRIIYEYEYYN